MRRLLVPLLLLATEGRAATAYVTDDLVLGLYADPSTEGPRLATLHSGALVETLGIAGESTRVRLVDGLTGWVKSAYLTNSAPSAVRIAALQAELDRSRATSPALAEAAERSEVQRLTRELAHRQTESGVARSAPATGSPAHVWAWLAAVVGAFGCGYWRGHASLARRLKNKFGGIKVY